MHVVLGSHARVLSMCMAPRDCTVEVYVRKKLVLLVTGWAAAARQGRLGLLVHILGRRLVQDCVLPAVLVCVLPTASLLAVLHQLAARDSKCLTSLLLIVHFQTMGD